MAGPTTAFSPSNITSTSSRSIASQRVFARWRFDRCRSWTRGNPQAHAALRPWSRCKRKRNMRHGQLHLQTTPSDQGHATQRQRSHSRSRSRDRRHRVAAASGGLAVAPTPRLRSPAIHPIPAPLDALETIGQRTRASLGTKSHRKHQAGTNRSGRRRTRWASRRFTETDAPSGG